MRCHNETLQSLSRETKVAVYPKAFCGQRSPACCSPSKSNTADPIAISAAASQRCIHPHISVKEWVQPSTDLQQNLQNNPASIAKVI